MNNLNDAVGRSSPFTIFATLVFIIISIFFLYLRYWIFFVREKQKARILHVSPYFEETNQSKIILCEYSYVIENKEKIKGKCLISLKSFLHNREPKKSYIISRIKRAIKNPRPAFFWDPKEGIPILSYGYLDIAGAETIEHYLLQLRNELEISYSESDPTAVSFLGLRAIQLPI